jgi:hypothetical protein
MLIAGRVVAVMAIRFSEKRILLKKEIELTRARSPSNASVAVDSSLSANRESVLSRSAIAWLARFMTRSHKDSLA